MASYTMAYQHLCTELPHILMSKILITVVYTPTDAEHQLDITVSCPPLAAKQ